MTTVLDLFITVVYFVLLLICPSGNYSSKKVLTKVNEINIGMFLPSSK